MVARGDILVVNAGSTSIKLSLVADSGASRAVHSVGEAAGAVAVGHRIVHGGDRFVEPTLIDDAILAELDALTELAPLHNAPALEAIATARAELSGTPQVAVFDTAFHRTLPERARTYPLPARFREIGIERYGFHGLSIQWAVEQVVEPRVVVCHLGGGSSVTAVQDGRSVDTTMGFSPLEGVPMATRSGSIDPGAVIYLLRHGVSLDELDHALEHESGLTGLAGSGDVARLESDGSAEAALALEIYCYRVAQAVAAMATALGGLDALVFTGGVGERSASVRTEICTTLAFLGITLADELNEANQLDTLISASASRVRVHIVRSREDVVIARAVRRVLGRKRR